MVFTIYDHPTALGAANKKWSKTYPSVQVRNGNFQVSLGQPTGTEPAGQDDTTNNLANIFDGSPRWLGITVFVSGAPEPELIPRQQLVTVPHAFVADKLTTPAVPKGAVMMWSGTLSGNFDGTGKGIGNLSGWALCNGQNGTPNLQDRFILGTSAGENPGATGGTHSQTLSVSNMPSHSHSGTTNSAGEHSHSVRAVGDSESEIGHLVNTVGGSFFFLTQGGSGWKPLGAQPVAVSAGSHQHSFDTNATGSGQAFDNRPAFFKLAFIMKL